MNERDLPLSPLFVKLILCCGAVAQLGERLTGSQKVRGSTPLSSTKQSSEAKIDSDYRSIRPDYDFKVRLLRKFVELFKV